MPLHNHRPPEWIVNQERLRDVKEIGKLISQIGQKLSEKSEVTLSGHKVKPAEESTLILRYERTPHNDFILKIEIKWPVDFKVATSHSDEILIE